MLDLRPAVAEDAARLHALREAAARWLQARGIRQWQPGEVEMATFGTQIAAGEWFLDRRGGAVRAALRFLWSDTPFRGERPDDTGYVHGLVIDRGQAGEGLGGQLLGGAEDRTRQAGRRFLRLDCAADNERLRGHYRERGFVERGRREFRDWGPVVLLEKPLI
ncbi:MAG TPA: GNAT family N-acetyltransferase [Mycobacteriales bacterium]|nr:GNAT family N-acetyltransferase [Mycobacteriales bacterium]